MSAPGVTTLIASANISRSGQTAQRAQRKGSVFDELTIGQHLRMQVLRQLEQQRYEVAFGGRRHVVESRVALQPGSQVSAQVEAKGEKLELRYLDTGPRAGSPEESLDAFVLPLEHGQAGDDGGPAPPWLAALAAQYRVPLDARAREAIERAAAKAGDPELMTRGGLFLQKLLRNVDAQDLEALYRTLSPSESAPVAAFTQAPIGLEDLSGADDVAATLADALEAPREAPGAQVPSVGAESDGGEGAEQDSRRAARLLNLQDEGSVAWRFGTLPLLVGGQLIELDLVMFRERDGQAKRGALRRLVMTLDTTHFGRVHVEARAVDSRLMVKMSAASSDAVEVLSAYGADVRAAIERLGWGVDDIRYEITAPHAGAAQSVVHHVLSAGTVDQEL
jgi:hypothetical protein